MPDELASFQGSDLIPKSAPLERPRGLVPVPANPEGTALEISDLPRLQLLHGTSEPVKQRLPGAELGVLWLTVFDVPIEPPVRAVGLYLFYTRAMYIDKRDSRYQGLEECIGDRGGVGTTYGDCLRCGRSDSRNPASRTDWRKRQGPLCSLQYNWILLIEKFGPCVLRCERTSKPTAEALRHKWDMMGRDLWEHPLSIHVITREGQRGEFSLIDLRWDIRTRLPKEMQDRYRETFQVLERSLKEDYTTDGGQDEEPGPGD